MVAMVEGNDGTRCMDCMTWGGTGKDMGWSKVRCCRA